MAITKITHYCATSTMGDISDAAAENYRAWLKTQIENEFPGADVVVIDEDATTCVECDAEDCDAVSRLWECDKHAWSSYNWV